ncbi:hypothetical protein AQUCO_10900006v1 [Aquilegia coerulea]|uniref:RRM domain-containing protein n=1 Tax=Aquilegia coerulea TaxID=218851 RepID=A0A2G5C325_AQUCA|nr:hypothetical protein AQUCO_10900006v1 [Aquilegia coerulea]
MAFRQNSGLQYLNSPYGDTTYTKVFVGGLAWETQSDTLHRFFEQFGEILEAVVITDKNSGRSKGYGFVTFRDPEAARRACVDPSPFINGRRANCNLASLGRPRPFLYGPVRAGYPYIESVQSPRGVNIGSPIYQPQQAYNNPQGFAYPPPYGFMPSGSDYVYPQGVYNPYVGQPYLQMYGLPGTVGSEIYPYGQLRQRIPGNQGYTGGHAYAMPSHQIVQFTGPTVHEVTAAPIPTLQGPYPPGWISRTKSSGTATLAADFGSRLASCHLCILEVIYFNCHLKHSCQRSSYSTPEILSRKA